MDIALLNFFLGTFLIAAAYGPIPSSSFKLIKQKSQNISPALVILIIVIFLGLTLFLLSSNSKNLIVAYINTAFSLTVIGHASWLSLGKTKKKRLIYIAISLALIILKILWPSQLINNFFLIASISWLGQFLVKLGLLNLRRFTFISLAWLLYDIIFVWFTPLSQTVNTTTQLLNVPLGIMAGSSLIGTGDLLWASMLLAVTRQTNKVLTLRVLLLSNIALDLYAIYSQNLYTFPLLVIWVPLGLLLLSKFRH